jgi:large conductance mechanosensitive channel
MKGFQEFLLRGNLIELAVAVIMGTVFAAVVKSFTDMIMDIIGLFGGVPDFSGTSIYGIGVGAFLSALLTLILTGAVVYFLIIIPYNKLSEITKKDDPEVAASTEDLLAEIRDLLREQNAGRGQTSTPPSTPPSIPPTV